MIIWKINFDYQTVNKMEFDPENPINKLCARGMQLEGEGSPAEAARLFQQAWKEAGNAHEKFTAAHYVARHQNGHAEKLEWDMIALKYASEINSPEIKSIFPSLYLNIAKDFENLGDAVKARENYMLANRYSTHLPEDGYGSLIKSGINQGIERLGRDDLI